MRLPNNWATLFTKLADLLKKDYDWSKEVAAIKAPAIIVFADADAVRTYHLVEFFGLLGCGLKDGARVVQQDLLPNSPSCQASRTTISAPPSRSRRS